MSSHASEPPLHLEPRPSRGLARLLYAFHLATALLLLALPLNPVWCGALLLGTAGSLAYWRVRIRPPYRLIREPEGRWLWLERAGDEPRPLRLSPDSYVSRWLVILNFRDELSGASLSVPLPADSLPPERQRQLRVSLRVSGLADTQTAPP